MIDIHAYLNFEKFVSDVAGPIVRAKKMGVKKIIVPSSNLENSKIAIKLADRHPEIYAAVGIHPVYGEGVSLEVIGQLYTLLSAKKVVAVGEVGLDYYYFNKESQYRRYPSSEKQKTILIQMIKLAQDARLPLILHCREARLQSPEAIATGGQAYNDLIEFLQKEGIKDSGVIHCFQGDKKQAKKFLERGFYLSFDGNITYGSSLDDVIFEVPLERIMIETDSPFLTPVPYRGQRNEPAYLIEVAKQIAKIKNIPLVEVEKITENNAKTVFKV